jgi:hypothetical protein
MSLSVHQKSNNNIVSIKSLSNHGKKIYNSNTTIRDIANVMEHPEFKAFFDKYFKTVYDAQSILLLMKIYNSLPNEDPYEKSAILYEAMNNSKIRCKLVDDFIKWREDTKVETKYKKKMLQ